MQITHFASDSRKLGLALREISAATNAFLIYSDFRRDAGMHNPLSPSDGVEDFRAAIHLRRHLNVRDLRRDTTQLLACDPHSQGPQPTCCYHE